MIASPSSSSKNVSSTSRRVSTSRLVTRRMFPSIPTSQLERSTHIIGVQFRELVCDATRLLLVTLRRRNLDHQGHVEITRAAFGGDTFSFEAQFLAALRTRGDRQLDRSLER